ncbi:UDP-N-acetylglucosamine 1-carboxyvinyltransferase [Candidatus Berkelbacteria bacterium RIFOXYA2_FULL_43_10]|uniref:UDP-N-acetylglucosamine 1-carboxyvinyltransferase n=1 Tax=Candidatus Berkelbacteria bacterium RIFOXYA2_FULL_43_10 TaxID=1797472 RepID=A0A1F5EEX6_9BACT|nr:MAG: UDP-N-acetylglucosamine 1-carboxyvinyltransferase [Candidatus Berkelbacteria bacterium RIFOXYA2_FULL_43_10]
MSVYKIIGGEHLHGSVKISGAKNAALKIIAASIMADSPSTIHDVPRILDIIKLEEIIEQAGAKINVDGNTVVIDPSSINTTKLDHDLVKQLRGSIVLAGPMLSRFHQVEFAQPGGCLIGARPIDTHLHLFSQFGIKLVEGGDSYTLKGKPVSGDITLNELSVTATENAIMASVLSPGTTTIYAGACEPEIENLIDFLNNMGAKIKTYFGHKIEIEGVEKLHGTEHRIIPDRIEAGTYILAALATNSEIEVTNINPEHLKHVLNRIKNSGADISVSANSLSTKKHSGLKSVDIDTRTYPGFPTDLQSQYAVFSATTTGSTRIFETIFESRFGYIEEIKKMGADISVESPHIVYVHGPVTLQGTEIDALDIRGGAALVMAGLIANGTTTINGAELIKRGYEDMAGKLQKLGANIEEID